MTRITPLGDPHGSARRARPSVRLVSESRVVTWADLTVRAGRDIVMTLSHPAHRDTPRGSPTGPLENPAQADACTAQGPGVDLMSGSIVPDSAWETLRVTKTRVPRGSP